MDVKPVVSEQINQNIAAHTVSYGQYIFLMADIKGIFIHFPNQADFGFTVCAQILTSSHGVSL